MTLILWNLFIFIVILYYMDIYQIWVTHNPAWTRREIIFFVVVFTIVTIIEAGPGTQTQGKGVSSNCIVTFVGIYSNCICLNRVYT